MSGMDFDEEVGQDNAGGQFNPINDFAARIVSTRVLPTRLDDFVVQPLVLTNIGNYCPNLASLSFSVGIDYDRLASYLTDLADLAMPSMPTITRIHVDGLAAKELFVQHGHTLAN